MYYTLIYACSTNFFIYVYMSALLLADEKAMLFRGMIKQVENTLFQGTSLEGGQGDVEGVINFLEMRNAYYKNDKSDTHSL